MVFDSGDDFGVLVSGSSTTNGSVLAHNASQSNLIYRYLSNLQAGTFTHTVATGDENNPILSLGWDKIWSTAVGVWSGQGSATWQVEASPGYWISPVSEVNATSLSKLYWNEVLGISGSVNLSVRSGNDSVGILSVPWSGAFTNPSGSDVSSVTGDTFVQVRVSMDTSDFTTSPYLFSQDNFLAKLVYSKVGASAESSITGYWANGYMALSPATYPKIIKEIDVYYEGTEGTITFQLNNLKGDVVTNFTIDLAKERLATTNYYGSGAQKVFRWLASVPPTQANYLYGDRFSLTITDNGDIQPWTIQKIIIRYETLPYKPYS
jgi:hypothetical protein